MECNALDDSCPQTAEEADDNYDRRDSRKFAFMWQVSSLVASLKINRAIFDETLPTTASLWPQNFSHSVLKYVMVCSPGHLCSPGQQAQDAIAWKCRNAFSSHCPESRFQVLHGMPEDHSY